MASEAVKKSDRPPDEEREPAGTGTASEEEGIDALLGEPAHHARRPMNAFLIFCKRHRSVVRDRYPHLENRSITKILGEWWANLEPSEKGSYTELARQYKEAFLRANPDFKWYKLPAPPLRTLITRPSNQNKPHKLECQLTCGPITPGKLADESQMGGLSSLLASPPTTPTSLTPTSPTVPKPPKKRYLQEALLEANLATLPEEKLEEEQNGDLSFSQGEKFTSDFKVNYPSPFTKLRNHAVNQLNSIQERKTNRRRSSGDFKIMDTKTAFAKLKSTSNNLVMKSSSVIKSVITTNLPEKEVDDSAAYTPSEKSNLTRVNSFCNEREELVNGSSYINSSKSLSLETTIKASQQQIIDRVVDKLCGFSESLQQQQPVSPTMCSTTNAVSPQRSTSSPPPKASVIYSNIFMPNSPLRSESIDSFAVVENCKYNTDSENISSKHQECETRTINNNVYNNKDAALEMCKSEEMSRCRSEAAYTTMFYTTSSLEEQSLEAKDWQTKNFGASAHYFESMEGTKISRDGNSENNCDNCSETAPVIPDVAEPKALETSSRLSCQETSACQFPRTNSSEGEQNFSCMFENDCGSQFVDVTGNRMDLLPKFDSGLGIMEENSGTHAELISAVSKRDRHESGSSTTSDRTESAFSEGSREMELEFQQLQTAKSPLVLARKDSHTISKQQNNNKKPSSIGKTSSVFKDALSTTVNSPEKKSRKHSDVSEDSFSDSSPKKRFRAADFNLDEKIEALPSLSLEEFQLKKKQRKKRNLMTLGGSAKKSMITTTAISAKSSTSSQDPIPQNTISENGFKRSQSPEETSLIKSTSPPISGSNIVTTIIATVTATTITNSSPARMTPLVGSQKRKARKQCIMRLDPENAHTSRDTAVVEPDVLNNIGLATLAEVAAAKRKLAK